MLFMCNHVQWATKCTKLSYMGPCNNGKWFGMPPMYTSVGYMQPNSTYWHGAYGDLGSGDIPHFPQNKCSLQNSCQRNKYFKITQST